MLGSQIWVDTFVLWASVVYVEGDVRAKVIIDVGGKER